MDTLRQQHRPEHCAVRCDQWIPARFRRLRLEHRSTGFGNYQSGLSCGIPELLLHGLRNPCPRRVVLLVFDTGTTTIPACCGYIRIKRSEPLQHIPLLIYRTLTISSSFGRWDLESPTSTKSAMQKAKTCFG